MVAFRKNSFTSVTNRLLAMKFAGEFILIYPLYTIMFGERGNVTAAGIGALLAAGFALSVVFEVPTGVIGDKIPRKYVLLFGILAKVLALLAWLTMPFFWGYMLGTALFSLGAAFESGALQAYLYGTLGSEEKKSFGKFWARVNAMVMLSYTIAYVLTSIIGVHYPLLIILSIGACLIALAICMSLPKDTLAIINGELKPKILKSAVSHIAHSGQLAKLLVSALIVLALADVIIEFISLYYNQVGVGARLVPILMALGNIAGAAFFWTLHSYEKFLNKHKLLLTFFALLLFVASFWGGVIIASTGILIFTRFLRVLQIQFESNIQHLSNDEARVTITSLGSFGSKLLAAGIVALIGSFAVNNSIVKPLQFALVAGTALFIAIQLLTYRKEQRA